MTLLLAVIGLAAAPAPAPEYRPKLPPGRYLTQREVKKLVRGQTFIDPGRKQHVYTDKGDYIFPTDMNPSGISKYFVDTGRICIGSMPRTSCKLVYAGNNGKLYFIGEFKHANPVEMTLK